MGFEFEERRVRDEKIDMKIVLKLDWVGCGGQWYMKMEEEESYRKL